jgi:hypothetical protein
MRPKLAADCSCALAVTHPAAIVLREVDAGRLLESVA